MSNVSLSGNVTLDMQSLQSLVDQGGASGNQDIQDFAFAVRDEASRAGQNQDATTASNIAYSLGDGTYSQGASNDAIFASLQGKDNDSIGLGVQNTRSRILSGEDSASIVHDLNALGTEIGGDQGKQLKELASQISSGQTTSSGALPLLNQIAQAHGLPSKTGDLASQNTTGSDTDTSGDLALNTNILGGVEQGLEAEAFFASMFNDNKIQLPEQKVGDNN